MSTIRVATFNIRHGRGLDEQVDLRRTAALLSATGADVIALQEVDRGWERSGTEDQVAILRDLTGTTFHFCAAVVRGEARYGVALGTEREGDEAGGSGRCLPLPRVGGEEPRVVAVVEVAGLTVLATHLSRSAEARSAQIVRLGELAGAVPGPVIVMGDLNETSRRLAPLRAAGLDPGAARLRTHPAPRPRRQIDHVLAGGGARVTRAWTLPTRASDHLPLVADIAF